MHPSSTKVSIIVVNWNGEKFLQECLKALLSQTLKPLEIILVDNASTDGSLSLLRQFPALRIIALDYNAGFAKANNLAIAAASPESEWIGLVNPDAFVEPNWLEAI